MIKNTANTFRCERGLTLIDLSIALLVLGLLMAPLAQIAKNRAATIRDGNTRSNSAAVQKALEEYFYNNNSYPCPADPALSAGNADFGKALYDAALLPSPPCQGSVVDAGGDVMIGAVPFQDLKLPPEMALDGWKNKLTYVVSGEMTRTDKDLDPDDAILIVRGFDTNTVTHPDGEEYLVCSPNIIDFASDAQGGEAHYILFSSGARGIGAYTANGILTQACPSGAAETRESENCDADVTFFAEYCANGQTDGPNFYDDILVYENSIPTKNWANSASDNTQIFSDIQLIGINNDQPQTQMHVNGNVLLSAADPPDPDVAGFTHTEEICDITGNNCFEPELIGGDDPRMRCNNTSESTVMSGIGGRSALCNVDIGANFINGSCPAGQYMNGFDEDGDPICITP